MTGPRPAGALLAALLLAAGPAAAAGGAISPREAASMLRALAAPIAHCVARRDTGHAAFPGCIDWHSSVHGTWALIAIMRATGSTEFDGLVDERLGRRNIEAEQALLRAEPGFEMPYGRAWFLRLAIDDRAHSGGARLAPMADEVAQGLAAWLESQPPRPWSGSYDSQSWALMNLLDHAGASGSDDLRRRARALALRLIGQAEGPCPVEREHGNFMAICTNLAALAARVLPPAELDAWLAAFFAGVRLRPVERPVGAHHAGLNFSRAWGLREIWRATGDDRWARLYRDHVRATFERPEDWRGDYRSVAHWVAQFGVYALQPLFGPEAGR